MWARAMSWRTLGVALAVEAPGQLDQVRSQPARMPGRGDAGALAAAPLEDEHGPGDRPPFIDLTDHVVVAELDVIEELLAELGVPVDLPDGLHGHAGLVGLDGEPGQAPMLRDVPVGPGQAHPVVGVIRPARPDLRPVEDPAVAIPGGPALDARQVRSGDRLGEELDPELVAGQDPRDVAAKELGRGVHEHGRAAHLEGRRCPAAPRSGRR